MYNASIQTLTPRANVVGAIASLLILIGAGAAQAVPINPAPGAITCKVGEPGRVGGDTEGFFDPELNGGLGGPEIDLGGFNGVDCGPTDPGVGDPPPPVPPDFTRFPFPGDRDIVLHGLYELHSMY